MRGQGKRYEIKTCVQPCTVANLKLQYWLFNLKDCCRTQNFLNKNKCAQAQKAFQSATAIATQRSALAKCGEFIDCLPGADDNLKREVETTA